MAAILLLPGSRSASSPGGKWFMCECMYAMHGCNGIREHSGYLCDVHASKDGSRLTDARQPLGQQLWRQMVEVQVDVVLLWTTAPALPDLHGHAAGHHVS